MPFTQAYTDHLNNLSDSIENALNQLHQESLDVFVGDGNISRNSKLGLLLKKESANLTPDEQSELLGDNTNEYGARQRFFVFAQIWNHITRLKQDISDKKLLDLKKLKTEIDQLLRLLDKSIAPYAKDLFRQHDLSERKIAFVKSFIAVAHELLKKQCATKALLKNNVSHETPLHPTNENLSTAKRQYNEAENQHKNAFSSSILTHQSAIFTIETISHQINSLSSTLLAKKTMLSKADDEISAEEKSLTEKKEALQTLIDSVVSENLTSDQLEQLDNDYETAAEALITQIRSYRSSVIDKTEKNRTDIAEFIETQNSALQALEVAATTAFPQSSLDERALKNSLANLTGLWTTLKNCMNDEIQALTRHKATLEALKWQVQRDTQNAGEAYQLNNPILDDKDATTLVLNTFENECKQQQDTFANMRSYLPGKSSPWSSLNRSVSAQLKNLDSKHTQGSGLLQAHSTESILDTSEIAKLNAEITQTSRRIDSLRDCLRKTQANHKNHKDQDRAYGRELREFKQVIEEKFEACQTILEHLSQHTTNDALTLHRQNLNEARDTLRQVNQKRRDIQSKIAQLLPYQSEADYLKQRLDDLKQKFEANPCDLDNTLHPDSLLTELEDLPITLALTNKPTHTHLLKKIDLDINTSPLEQLRKKIDELEDTMAHANQSYHYRRKGTFIGSLAGGGLTLLLCGGIAASIYFSFGLALPILIGVGIAAAISPTLGASIGRFFGWRKDKFTFKNARLQSAQSKSNVWRNIRNERSERILLREKSVLVEPEKDLTLDTALAKTNREIVVQRRKTVIFPQLDAIPINFSSTANLNSALLSGDQGQSKETILEDVAQSYPVEVATPANKSVHFEDSDKFESGSASTPFEQDLEPFHQPVPAPSRAATPEPAYSLINGGIFKPKEGIQFSLSFTQRPAPQ